MPISALHRRVASYVVCAVVAALAVVLLLALIQPPPAVPAAHVRSPQELLLQASRTSTQATRVGSAQAAPAGVTVVAVGDIACPPGSAVTSTTCKQAATANYALSLDPDYVMPLGDTQYEKGSSYDFAHSYANSWGKLKSITKAVVGNHEYLTHHADGFYGYFTSVPRPGYYTFTLNGWRVYVLNSNCDRVDCTKENAWFDAQLAAHPAACTLMAMHHPRYSSGREHGSSIGPRPFWRTAYRHHVDVALAGHDHDYERFVRLDGDNHYRKDDGILSFVSGTGGKSLYHMGTKRYGSEYFQASRFGVLELTLGAGTWSWDYRSIGNASLDAGTRSCV